MAVFAVFLLILTVASCASIDERLLENEVEVPGVGRILGITSQTKWTNRLVYEFRGVPYAEPPEKERRFLVRTIHKNNLKYLKDLYFKYYI
jgi:hypothetical protein